MTSGLVHVCLLPEAQCTAKIYIQTTSLLHNKRFTLVLGKDPSTVKADFKSVPPQPYFEFCATFQYWLAQRFQNKVEEERF